VNVGRAVEVKLRFQISLTQCRVALESKKGSLFSRHSLHETSDQSKGTASRFLNQPQTKPGM